MDHAELSPLEDPSPALRSPTELHPPTRAVPSPAPTHQPSLPTNDNKAKMTDEKQALEYVHIVWHKKDFHAVPKIMLATLDEDLARDLAWSQAKSKWRYTGPRRESYTYFDQEIRVESIPLHVRGRK